MRGTTLVRAKKREKKVSKAKDRRSKGESGWFEAERPNAKQSDAVNGSRTRTDPLSRPRTPSTHAMYSFSRVETFSRRGLGHCASAFE